MPRREMVDGQEMVLLNCDDWNRIRDDPKMEGMRFAMPEWIDGSMDFIRIHPEFTMGFWLRRDKWTPCILLKLSDRWQRVHIECLTCDQCGWIGDSANPGDSTLYIGVTDEWNAMKQARMIPKKKCPRCSAKLPRESIWVESDSVGRK